MGHYATALLPFARNRGWPLWLLLLCGQFGDVLWLVLALFGIEPIEPTNFLDVSLLSMKTSMLWSHGLLPVLVQALIITAVVFAVFRDRALAVACGALIVGHLLCDYLVGWRHEVAGADTVRLGLGLYERAPAIYVGFLLEALFCAGCVW